MRGSHTDNTSNSDRYRFRRRILQSKAFGRFVELPVIRHLVGRFVQSIPQFTVRATKPIARPTTNSDSPTLDQIVEDFVEELGYEFAIIARHTQDDALVLCAFYISDESEVNLQMIKEWEEIGTSFIDPKYLADPTLPYTTTDFQSPNIGRVYLYDEEYKDNLSVIGVTRQEIIISNSLHDLYLPMIPRNPVTESFIQGIQDKLNVEQLVSVPFFTNFDGELEIVGNLFAGKSTSITDEDVETLNMFARYAAGAIEGEYQRRQLEISQSLTLQVQQGVIDERSILDSIVAGVVNELGYSASWVATYEEGDYLPIKAFYIDTQLMSINEVQGYEQRFHDLGLIDPKYYRVRDMPISMSDVNSPNIGGVFLNDPDYQENISTVAAKSQDIVIRDSLYYLFAPLTPKSSKPILEEIEKALGLKSVIAVPFFMGDEFIGNLFAVSRRKHFNNRDVTLLKSFGKQAAVGIFNARQYRKSEDRRIASETFGTMAFSASANVHALRNHLGAVNPYLQILELYYGNPDMEPMLEEHLKRLPSVRKRLNEASNILDHLNEPWKSEQKESVPINFALQRALQKSNDIVNVDQKIPVHEQYGDDDMAVYTSRDMLIEAFKIIIKNGMEAILEAHESPPLFPFETRNKSVGEIAPLEIESRSENGMIVVTIKDSGVGIKPRDEASIFQLKWSTKETGMGFGLFWVRDYIEGLDGRIDFESEYGHGTQFDIYLPFSTVGQPSEETP